MKKNKLPIFFGTIIFISLIFYMYDVFSFNSINTMVYNDVTVSPAPITEIIKDNVQKYDTNDYYSIINKNKEVVVEKYDEPILEFSDDRYVYLNYQTDYPIYPTQILLKNDKVQLVREILSGDDPRMNILTAGEDLISNYFVKYIDDYGPSFPVYIYPSEGIAFLKHREDKILFQIWYFYPTSKINIEQTWGLEFLRDVEDLQHE